MGWKGVDSLSAVWEGLRNLLATDRGLLWKQFLQMSSRRGVWDTDITHKHRHNTDTTIQARD